VVWEEWCPLISINPVHPVVAVGWRRHLELRSKAGSATTAFLQRLALNQARSMAPGLNERLRARITIGLSPQLLPARSRNELI
jgi:hypothetical protein